MYIKKIYSLYPILNGKIENNMVRTGNNDLNQPQDGDIENFIPINKWVGFLNLTTTTKLDELGCDRFNWTCTPYPWLVSEAYWTGSTSGPTYIWCAAGNNYFCNYDWSYARGIRPVITVSKSEIIF